jgi:hypothetical protein
MAGWFGQCQVLTSAVQQKYKPSDISVEQPTKFELIISLTTAKAFRRSHEFHDLSGFVP